MSLPKKIISLFIIFFLFIFPSLLTPQVISAQNQGNIFRHKTTEKYINDEKRCQELEKANPDYVCVYDDRAERTRLGAIVGGMLSYTTDMGAVNEGQANAMDTVTDL